MKGTLGVFTRSNGVVIASVVDVSDERTADFTVEDSQRMRVRDRLDQAIIQALCSADVADVVGEFAARRIVEGLVKHRGYHATIERFGDE